MALIRRRPVWHVRHFAVVALAFTATVCVADPASGQSSGAPDPREAQPERPTLATHAHTVSPGYVEIETGFQRQPRGAAANRISVPCLIKIGLGAKVQLDVAPGWQRDAVGGGATSGITDALVGIKWRLADRAPVMGALSVQALVSLPTGSSGAGRGTGSAGVSLLAISSRKIGRVSLDTNVGYVRMGGDGEAVPRSSTLWTVAAAVPVVWRFGWNAEVFGYPGARGPAGARPVAALLTGPTVTIRPSVVLDAGATFDIAGFGGTAVYAGVTWNVGLAWGPRPHGGAGPHARGGRRP